MHAWGEKSTDQKPTLERTFRLIYFALLEHNLGLSASRHLIDFDAKEVRAPLIEQSSNPLIQAEWRELQHLKVKDWRMEMLAVKNRLFRLLTSSSIPRFMGLPDHSINLSEIIEEGSILLVRLAPSDDLSHENARVFGAMLVNEFFESAMRRKIRPKPKSYFLYLDEFQDFLSPAIADMLDQIRKFGIFLILGHQRFGQLDENIIDAVLTNCRVKAVFGGLRVETARRMAEELFIGKLDPMKVKAAIYQTKFWPVYSRDKVYTHGTSHGINSSSSSTTGGSSASSDSISAGSSQSYFYDDWFSLPQLAGTRTETTTRGNASLSGKSSSWAESSTEGENFSESEAVADVPIFIPVPFQELSNVQHMSLDEQLHQMTAALKNQFPRHCFIKVQNEETEPMLVPTVEDVYVTEEGKEWYRTYQLDQVGALPVADVDALLKQQETALLQAAKDYIPGGNTPSGEPLLLPVPSVKKDHAQIWNRVEVIPPTAGDGQQGQSERARGNRGPKKDLENQARLAKIVAEYGPRWKEEDRLLDICERLDAEGVLPPELWQRRKPPARTWKRQLANDSHVVKQVIIYRCKAAGFPAS
jgi:hypothetical protein